MDICSAGARLKRALTTRCLNDSARLDATRSEEEEVDESRKLVAIAAAGLNAAGAAGVDVAVLPESVLQADSALVATLSRIAEAHGIYVIAPIKEADEGEARLIYNTALVLDRQGRLVGKYRKRFPFWGFPEDPPAPTRPGGSAGACQPPPVFDTDFGRVAVLICFDVNFTELWMHLAARGARIVFWPSMYEAGKLISALARVFHINIISAVPTEHAPPQMLDMAGEGLPASTYAHPDGFHVYTTEVNLQDQLIHFGELLALLTHGSFAAASSFLGRCANFPAAMTRHTREKVMDNNAIAPQYIHNAH